jgi:hypothetical protein
MRQAGNAGTPDGKRGFRDSVRWSLDMVDKVPAQPFCNVCQTDTIAVDTGNLVTFNFIGETFIGRSNTCPRCGSVERYMFFTLLLPIIPLGKWKVKYLSSRKFLARKMMKSSFPDLGRQHIKKRNRVLGPLLLLLLLVLVFGVGAVIFLNPSRH